MTREQLQEQINMKRDLLTENVKAVRTAIDTEIDDRKQALRDATDWRYYVKSQPAVTLGGALAVGVLVGKALGTKVFERVYHEEPDLRDRAAGYFRAAENKFNEMRGRAVHNESKWKARTRSAFSSGGDLLVRELAKAAQHMIIPTVVAAVTGKMASDNKTTIIEKKVEPHTGRERTESVRQFDQNGSVTKASDPTDPSI